MDTEEPVPDAGTGVGRRVFSTPGSGTPSPFVRVHEANQEGLWDNAAADVSRGVVKEEVSSEAGDAKSKDVAGGPGCTTVMSR